MKKIVLVFILSSFLFQCEDPIDVDLNTAPPRLVVDASINWVKGTTGNEQSIKLTLTSPFFEDNVQVATGASVIVRNSLNDVFIFSEESGIGIYSTDTFQPELNETYSLEIIYESQTYTATESLLPVSSIDFIEQKNDGGFTGEDIELKAFYTDPPNEENYYFFEFISDIPVVPTLEVYEDRFTDGNQIFGFYTEEDLESGDIVTIRNHGVSERFYEFMFILLQQGSDDGGGPFETQPATVRGNVVNTTDSDNFPFGYFRLSEVDEVIYTVE
ncbi:DUF4249 domain-containing protein [Winogradskyella maritima]|uniref:DUF4249 domain-containing protein n=1 Tax=Winogradskyella maritima TaxID=1517766 RepID=A0ABV8AGU9_9FLAO|nr:DUF4249 domain-containing protein [Winogradskyella maritima]